MKIEIESDEIDQAFIIKKDLDEAIGIFGAIIPKDLPDEETLKKGLMKIILYFKTDEIKNLIDYLEKEIPKIRQFP